MKQSRQLDDQKISSFFDDEDDFMGTQDKSANGEQNKLNLQELQKSILRQIFDLTSWDNIHKGQQLNEDGGEAGLFGEEEDIED